MIKGIGTDIIEIDRISLAVKNRRGFIEKLFTNKEKEYFEKKKWVSETIAGNFAAKEAVSKALGTGVRGFSMKDIEILRDELGKPSVRLSEKVLDKFQLKNCIVHISISHNNTSAIAYAILEERECT